MFSFPFMWETEYTMVMSHMLLFNQIRQVLSTNDVAILIQAKLHTAKKGRCKNIIRHEHDKHIVDTKLWTITKTTAFQRKCFLETMKNNGSTRARHEPQLI
jgi:hypothetical protein